MECLDRCLEQLEGQNVMLCPSQASYWFAGMAPLSVADARLLIAVVGVAHVRAYVSMSVPHVQDGVYAVGPDGQAWGLFYIVPARPGALA